MDIELLRKRSAGERLKNDGQQHIPERVSFLAYTPNWIRDCVATKNIQPSCESFNAHPVKA